MTDPFAVLNGHQYMSLTTFRKNGQPVSTPVWFAQEGDKLYVLSSRTAGKIKRISHTSRVTLAPCDMRGRVLGETVEATARILEPNEHHVAITMLNKKYGMMKRILDLMARFTGGDDRAYLEIIA
ncbi:MAG: PPOX class F420-dependent oxidoreductase [Anaerolineae bacterium]|nr:PPOX class F420-dependent oxidoreductase [Anaerolineae bacterium]